LLHAGSAKQLNAILNLQPHDSQSQYSTTLLAPENNVTAAAAALRSYSSFIAVVCRRERVYTTELTSHRTHRPTDRSSVDCGCSPRRKPIDPAVCCSVIAVSISSGVAWVIGARGGLQFCCPPCCPPIPPQKCREMPDKKR